MSFDSSYTAFKQYEFTRLTFDTCGNFFDITTSIDNSLDRQIMDYEMMFVNSQASLMDGIAWLGLAWYEKNAYVLH